MITYLVFLPIFTLKTFFLLIVENFKRLSNEKNVLGIFQLSLFCAVLLLLAFMSFKFFLFNVFNVSSVLEIIIHIILYVIMVSIVCLLITIGALKISDRINS